MFHLFLQSIILICVVSARMCCSSSGCFGQDAVFYSGTRLAFHNRNDFFLLILSLSDETLNRGLVSV